MKFFITAIISFFFINTGKAQASFSGEYKMVDVINDSVSYNLTLKLNCNGTYITRDTFQISYGKWKSRNSDLILLTDSSTVNNKTNFINYKIVYENIDNKFHMKYVSKKAYFEALAEIRKLYPMLGKDEGFKKYEEKTKAKYFEKIIGYDCK